MKHRAINHDRATAIPFAIEQADLGQLLACVVAFARYLRTQPKGDHWSASLKTLFGANTVSISTGPISSLDNALPAHAKNGKVWVASAHSFIPLEHLADDMAFDYFAFVLQNTAKAQTFVRLEFSEQPNAGRLVAMPEVALALSELWQDHSPAVTVEGGKHLDILAVDNPFGLTRSETRVCCALKEGMRPTMIAAHLNVGIATIRTHLSNIYAKTDLPTQSAVVRHLTLNSTSMHRITE